ncbi:hypothetical protein PH210_06260 [Paenibacillus sp. BSR1-1]|uniref:hypothetical protein n=1 Tax=Paenibacillus sp. BSR1-1 TaxID=3020845 RepID=UPI0025AF2D56|nr:hypothetical protein [Paenibacillus sp. BSR1-1]MDN3015809.1 hypothetical protein [Paenibacillus sp. BSR1-1]
MGNLFLVDLEKGEQEELVIHENSYIPKNIIWDDNEHIYYAVFWLYCVETIHLNKHCYRKKHRCTKFGQ